MFSVDGARRSRDLVEAASDRLEAALAEAPVPPARAATLGKRAFDAEVAEPTGIEPPFRALDHLVLQTAGRVALTRGRPDIDFQSLRQAVGVWKAHAGRHGDLDRARDNAAAALAELRQLALPHKKPQVDAARRTKALVDALWRAERATQ